jgi:branched-chain amino acid transport system ATP-binding protein
MTNILEATKVVKRFGGLVAVSDLTFSIPKSSIVSIIGPNGAGKTTFFNCITGFYNIDEGKIMFNGHSINGRSPDQIAHLGISRTYQNIRLFASMSAIENISWPAWSRQLRSPGMARTLPPAGHAGRRREALGEANRLLASSACAARATAWPATCPMATSGGWRSLARWPANRKLLLLDEPTAGMNPRETAETTEFIRHLRDEVGITILLIEHDMRVSWASPNTSPCWITARRSPKVHRSKSRAIRGSSRPTWGAARPAAAPFNVSA